MMIKLERRLRDEVMGEKFNHLTPYCPLPASKGRFYSINKSITCTSSLLSCILISRVMYLLILIENRRDDETGLLH
jgi:hypothetical protein